MAICNHNHTKKVIVSRELHGQKFNGEAVVCNDCHSELWDDPLFEKFNLWVLNLHCKPRIQFKMSTVASTCLDEIVKRFPGANRAILGRALITIYMSILKDGPEANDFLNTIYDTEYFHAFENDNKLEMFQSDVKPVLYFDIQSWAKSFDMKPNEFSSEAYHLMIAMCISEDEKLKEFWNKRILPQIETIIKAA